MFLSALRKRNAIAHRLRLTLRSVRESVVTRVLNAPRKLVFGTRRKNDAAHRNARIGQVLSCSMGDFQKGTHALKWDGVCKVLLGICALDRTVLNPPPPQPL